MLLLKNKGKRRVVLSCQVFHSVGAKFIVAEIGMLPMYYSVFKVSVLLLSGMESLVLRAVMGSSSVPRGYPAVASWGWSTTKETCSAFALFLHHSIQN